MSKEEGVDRRLRSSQRRSLSLGGGLLSSRGGVTRRPGRSRRPPRTTLTRCKPRRRIELRRVKLVRYFRNITWLNLRLSKVVQGCHGHEAALKDEGLLQEHVHEPEWARYRGVLDIDGNVDAWGLRWRLESGSVFFLVRLSYQHFFSNSLVDGIHYISIDAKLDNLREKTSIVHSQEVEDVKYLENVAKNAKLHVAELTYLKVTSAVARALLLDKRGKQ
mmetsp:Transcript_3951/g.13731  ORF Transcript_3951/g.13731 Transcript_3951/m.13731 type:complete len:219 (+) Transcript_3951:2118-2774(+)